MESLEFYIVRNKEGKYLRAKGYSGYGDSWVTELNRAIVYTKKGGAAGQITWWATHYPDYGIPDLIPLTATLGEPIDQTERVSKVKQKKELEKAKFELWQAKNELERALKSMERATGHFFKDVLDRAQSKVTEIEDKINELSKK